MTLTTHAIAGAIAMELFPGHPVVGFVAGFATHFLLDAVPHYDYKVYSNYANPEVAMEHNAHGHSSKKIHIDKHFYLDLVRIGSDAILGLILSVLILRFLGIYGFRLILLGAIAGMLPDFLQFVYMRFPYQPLTALQKFHINFMHTKVKLKHLHPIIGFGSQILFIIGMVILARYLLV